MILYIIIMGTTDSTELTFSQKKAAFFQNLLSAVPQLFKALFIRLSLTNIQKFGPL